ncbi:MAG: hypothetical protein FJW38_10760 [Acidobacteria bacterium]|nr:hypothetical protein [Acidobacteriota bacterium]
MTAERWLAAVVRYMPAERAEWGAAMLAELHQMKPAEQWRFAISCTRVALFPPPKGGHEGMAKGILGTLAIVALAALALSNPETGGTWLARAINLHIVTVLVSRILLVDWLVLAGLAWGQAKRAKGVEPWTRVPAAMQRRVRLAVELYFGLFSPVLYLAILTSWPGMQRLRTDWAFATWIGPLHVVAAVTLLAAWAWRLYGAAFRPETKLARGAPRLLLCLSLVLLAAFALKDLTMVMPANTSQQWHWTYSLLTIFLFGPMYLIPGVLLYGYLCDSAKTSEFLLLTTRTSRAAIAAAVAVAVLTTALAMQRRGDDEVKRIVFSQSATIRTAAARYDTDPRLIAAIVYVTHRDQLSPLRESVERVASTAWGIGLADRTVNQALDLSLGAAQIKPRTLQTGVALAVADPRDFSRAGFIHVGEGEGNVEPLGVGWSQQIGEKVKLTPPIRLEAERNEIVAALHIPEKNLEMCAFLLALYQRQWEIADPAWSIRHRPDILATLYQIGFVRSKPHGSPRSNAFGDRVREVYHQPWLAAEFQQQQPPRG